MNIATTIFQQIGGNKFRIMTGATAFVSGTNYLSFRFKMCKFTNMLKIILMDDDTYRMEFYKYNQRKYEAVMVKEYNGIYCDQLQDIFTSVTGLYTHL